jgi:small subunit ribosomal protein S6
MAYKVNKNRKGHYAFIKSEASASAVQEMERLMRLHDDVMRVMTIKVKAHEEGPSVMMGSKPRHREDKPESTPVVDSKSKSGDE